MRGNPVAFWMLVLSLVAVAVLQHTRAKTAVAALTQNVDLLERAAVEVEAADSAVVRALRLGCGLVVGDGAIFEPGSYEEAAHGRPDDS
jgi:hypothetical protein